MIAMWVLSRLEGRIGRGRYWLSVLIILVAMMASLLLLVAISNLFGLAVGTIRINLIGISAAVHPVEQAGAIHLAWYPQIIMLPMTLVFAWLYISASVKRLHDLNMSGWWLLLFDGAVGLYGHVAQWLDNVWVIVALGIAVLIVFVWGLILLYCRKGTSGFNRFGPDPLKPAPKPAPAARRWDQQGALEFAPHRAGRPAGAHVMRRHD
jgi:uncharacterized membrane protein YhaH (DUF805 family)